jgi:hypothetical protein
MLQLGSLQGVKIQPYYIKIISINSIALLLKFRESVQPSRPKIATTPIKFGVFCYEKWTVFCEKGVRSDVILSSMKTPGRKLKEVIVDGHVLDKNLLRFRKIHLQLAVAAPAKSGLKRKMENLEK